MATAVVLPKVGNTVEECIITSWEKQAGDSVAEGEILCAVETDKAIVEIESTASGTLLATFYDVGDVAPVLTNLAVIGQPGEDVEPFAPEAGKVTTQEDDPKPTPPAAPVPIPPPSASGNSQFISPRARNLARQKNIPIDNIQGTGPGGRIIERDIEVIARHSTPLARAIAAENALSLPAKGSGLGGRVTTDDLSPVQAATQTPIQGVRRTIADRMRRSLQETAQLTMTAAADARALRAYRARLKESSPELGLGAININDLILFAVSRALANFPQVNATLVQGVITEYPDVNLAFAVDTPRGLIVPVIRGANHLSLKALSGQAKTLAEAAQNGSIAPDDLKGGTFTVSNLGSFGIETFTPIINPPQVAILGVGNIHLKAVEAEDEIAHIPHLSLSLTIDHQVVDGAPGARFLQSLITFISDLDLLTAL